MCQSCYWANNNIKAKKKRQSRYCTEWGFKTEKELFDSFKSTNPRSFISNVSLKCYLSPDTWYICCHHVLCKDRFPLFRLNPANIVLLTPFVEHYDIHNKEKAQLGGNWAKYWKLYLSLLEDYHAFRA